MVMTEICVKLHFPASVAMKATIGEMDDLALALERLDLAEKVNSLVFNLIQDNIAEDPLMKHVQVVTTE